MPPIVCTQGVRYVYTPTKDTKGCELWMFANAHARVNDASYHQLPSTKHKKIVQIIIIDVYLLNEIHVKLKGQFFV